ncbi:hypothetical protein OJ997_30830 [Solirubrobacter phytolaccae]|uniref:DUF7144 domain-containing protein n=1 Tax=Solirubrobacter phytolaccae TaxID=1404360 RepID=A0A9X3NE32_9ACTN|nr:hypothetical protein [Solirubrobacter phytolaccae]MDA0184738.1 hypothetical protein [Solirubrobacter phytolaccae]
MATQTQPPRGTTRVRSRSGWITFAGSYLVLAGALNLIWGVTALANASYFREDGLLWSDLTFWGWVAVIIAAVQILGGALVFMQRVGGMIMAIVLAMAGILLNFTSIGAYPVWSSIAIVCSMLVLWAVTVHWEELS